MTKGFSTTYNFRQRCTGTSLPRRPFGSTALAAFTAWTERPLLCRLGVHRPFSTHGNGNLMSPQTYRYFGECSRCGYNWYKGEVVR